MSKYVKETATWDVEVIRGEPLSIPFIGWELDDAPWDLEAEEVRAWVKPSINIASTPVEVFEVVVQGSDIYLNLTQEQTANLNKLDVYRYDLVINDIVYIIGKLTMSGRVTR